LLLDASAGEVRTSDHRSGENQQGDRVSDEAEAHGTRVVKA
jgi:hypothetical protein